VGGLRLTKEQHLKYHLGRRLNMTKKEQLKEVFLRVIFEYIHKNIPINLHNIEVLSNLLLKEVTIRTNL